MSYVALATARFDEVARFYGDDLGFPVIESWEHSNGRSRVFSLNGLRLEILDNAREKHPLRLLEPADRFHLVIEVDDVEAVHRQLEIAAPPLQTTSWGARLFQVRDPDGVPVTFLQWEEEAGRRGRPKRDITPP